MHFWRAVLAGVSVGCGISLGKGGWGLYALQGFSRQGRKLEGCIRKAHSSGKLDEARLLGKMDKCETRETYVNIDRNLL